MTQQTEQQGPIWLTQKAFDELTAELEDMKGPRRQHIVGRISSAREEGDLTRTAATTPPARSRASSRARSASSSTCCCTPRPRSRPTTASWPPARS